MLKGRIVHAGGYDPRLGRQRDPSPEVGRASADSDVPLTAEERAAIAALKRLAKKWPRSLMLLHRADCGICVTRSPTAEDGAANQRGRVDGRRQFELEDLPVLAEIDIRADSCAR